MDIKIVKKVDIVVTEQDITDMITAKIKAADPSITVNTITYERKLKPTVHISVEIDADFGTANTVVDEVTTKTEVASKPTPRAVKKETVVEKVVVEEKVETIEEPEAEEIPNQVSEEVETLTAGAFMDGIAEDKAVDEAEAAILTVNDIFTGN